MNESPCIDDIDYDFKSNHANDSHKWLFTYPESIRPQKEELLMSLTKETYTVPKVDRRPKQGRRKKLLEDFYRELISKQLKNEMDVSKIIVENYETDYTENFKNPDDFLLPGEKLNNNAGCRKLAGSDGKLVFHHAEDEIFQKLKMKYPLYGSKPMTFYGQRTGKGNFGISTTISKPIDENYDNTEY